MITTEPLQSLDTRALASQSLDCVGVACDCAASQAVEHYAAQLASIREQMRDAFEREQWQDLADLDTHCRTLVTAIVEVRDQSLLLLLSETLFFYRELLAEFSNEKSNIAGDVMTLRRAQSSDRVYRIMDALN